MVLKADWLSPAMVVVTEVAGSRRSARFGLKRVILSTSASVAPHSILPTIKLVAEAGRYQAPCRGQREEIIEKYITKFFYIA